MTSIEQWWRAGEQSELLSGSGAERHIFIRRFHSSRPPMTLLHGFPSSSHDYAKVADELAERYSLLLPDFLGFGASDKPPGHDYSLIEQADLVQELWEVEGIESTTLVAHDYAVSVAQELLARRAEGTLDTDLHAIYFLNGGLYPGVHRPQPVQTALLDPVRGPLISAAMTEELFVPGLEPTFAPGYDYVCDAVEIWRSMERDDGYRNMHLLIHYMTDRQANRERWVTALERTDVPLSFIWGMLDPVSGAHMAERIRERLPNAPFTELPDVGHWPTLEAPERVAAAILAE
ncbi:MAG TPA: alpha/beta hydrolase [Solirubrobacteraceae bacterium]|nr:alpha/beta hydrolase [Solirubrobacteraceae bacterium]